MSSAVGVRLRDLIDYFGYHVIRDYGKIDRTVITVADITRPGLQLTGHFKHFGPDRMQLIGNMEMAYLKTLTPEEETKCLSCLFATGIPCLILSRRHEPSNIMLQCADRYETPILQSDHSTSSIYSSLVKYLNVELAPRVSVHGVLVEVLGEGVLILGESGVGKSETALELVKRGHRLIADDLVEIRRVSDTTLLGRAPEIIRHMIEIRGLGILNVKELYGVSSVKVQDNINFVINMEFWDESKVYNRLGIEDETTMILGVSVPSVTIPVRPGRNLAIIVEFASINFRHKKMGYNAARELEDRVLNGSYRNHARNGTDE
ncbi:MAG TPA: HPr(Ser) kinase/phosphatase [Clostridiaceae bacterium]|nr:HPr(Ser) kinase/phosphatase [Clostridiaceae bacterium]